jgi:hypothetical protein
VTQNYSYRIEWLGRIYTINRATPEAALRDRILKLRALQESSPKPKRKVQVRAA